MAKEKGLLKPGGLLLSVLLLVHLPKTRRDHRAYISAWLSGNDGMADFPEKKKKGNYGAIKRNVTPYRVRASVNLDSLLEYFTAKTK